MSLSHSILHILCVTTHRRSQSEQFCSVPSAEPPLVAMDTAVGVAMDTVVGIDMETAVGVAMDTVVGVAMGVSSNSRTHLSFAT